MLSKHEEQAERCEVLENDKRVREQGSTFLAHTHDDLSGGRFAKVSPQIIVGADPITNYPAAAAHQHDPVGPEPPLGYSVDAMPGDPTDVPASTTPLVEDRVGSPPSSRPFRRIK